MTRLPILAVLALLVAGEPVWSALYARQPEYRAGVDFVTVPIVLSTTARAVRGEPLDPGDFVVLEDGVRQDIEYVLPDQRPMSVSLVLDASNSMTPQHRSYAHLVLDAIARGLANQASAEVSQLAFARSVLTVLPWTRASDSVATDWSRVPAGDDTSLFDAVNSALRLVDSARNARTVVVLATDGGETTSSRSLQEIASTRQQSESTVYAFHIVPWSNQTASGGAWSSGENSAARQSAARLRASAQGAAMAVTKTIVGDSGGTVYTVRTAGNAKESAESFLRELDRQLILGYTSKRPFDGSYRRLEIRSRLQGVEVRHRRGYLAMPRLNP